MSLFERSQPQSTTHAVTYKVWGEPKGKWVIIRYTNRLNYGVWRRDAKPSVRIPASALPWRKTLQLPQSGYAWLSIEEEKPGQRGAFATSIHVNGKMQVMTVGKDNPYLMSSTSLERVVE